jgi:hypothetical protein
MIPTMDLSLVHRNCIPRQYSRFSAEYGKLVATIVPGESCTQSEELIETFDGRSSGIKQHKYGTDTTSLR